MSKLFKWPPKEAQEAFSKAIQERFKARTPKGRQDHYLRITDELTGFTISVPYTNKEEAKYIMNRMNRRSRIPPAMEVVSKDKLQDGEYIPQ